MIITIVGVITLALVVVGWNMFKGGNTYNAQSGTIDFYSLSCNTIDGEEYNFSQLKGKKVLIVNTASKCGFTLQYKGLQQLQEEYGDKLTVMAFPCNDFGKQESGTHEEINSFCEKNYGVSFLIMEKVKIKGSNPHPVYSWLLNESENGIADHNVWWNFHKFLIDSNGSLVGSYKSGVEPTDNRIISFASEK